MHPSLEELLEAEGPGASPRLREHVASCPACAEELSRIEAVRTSLRALPAERPAKDLWPAIARNVGRRRLRSRLHLAAAAAFLVGLFAAMSLLRGPSAPRAPQQDPKLHSLIRQSQQLEALALGLQARSPAMSGWQAYTISELESRIALVDARIAGAPAGGRPAGRTVDLWQERVRLLDALVQARAPRQPDAAI